MHKVNNSIKAFLLEEEDFEDFVNNESIDEKMIDDMENSLLYNKKLPKDTKKKIKESLSEGILEYNTLNFLIENNLIDYDEDVSLYLNREKLFEDFSMFHSDYVQHRMKSLIDVAHRHIMSKIALKNPKIVQDEKKLTDLSDHAFKKITEHVLKHSDKFSSENHKEHAKNIHAHLTSDDFINKILEDPKFSENEDKNKTTK